VLRYSNVRSHSKIAPFRWLWCVSTRSDAGDAELACSVGFREFGYGEGWYTQGSRVTKGNPQHECNSQPGAYNPAGYLHPLVMEGAPPSGSLIDRVRSLLEKNPQRGAGNIRDSLMAKLGRARL
jgi:hypothetical protein